MNQNKRKSETWVFLTCVVASLFAPYGILACLGFDIDLSTEATTNPIVGFAVFTTGLLLFIMSFHSQYLSNSLLFFVPYQEVVDSFKKHKWYMCCCWSVASVIAFLLTCCVLGFGVYTIIVLLIFPVGPVVILIFVFCVCYFICRGLVTLYSFLKSLFFG